MTKPSGTVKFIDPIETFQYLLPPSEKWQAITPEELRGGYVDSDGRRRLRLSPTKMDTFEGCPASFRAVMLGPETDDGTIYTAIGKAAHAILERINKGEKLDPNQREAEFKETLIQICDASMGTANEIPLSFPGGYKESKETIRNYRVPDGYRVFSSESKQVLRFSRFDFSYIADVILESLEDGAIEVRDYKTNAAVPKATIQLDMYAVMTLQNYPELRDRKIRSSYHMLRTDRVVLREYEPGYLDKAHAILLDQVDLMEMMFRLDCFDTRPSSSACRYCKLKASCPDVHDGRSDAKFISEAFGNG